MTVSYTHLIRHRQETVRTIVQAVADTQTTLRAVFPQLTALPLVDTQVSFVSAQELEDRWPELTPKQREDAWVKEHPKMCIRDSFWTSLSFSAGERLSDRLIPARGASLMTAS